MSQYDARWWKKTSPDASDTRVRLAHSVSCLLCPRACVLADNSIGICGARKNTGGTIRSLAHGRPAAVAIDPIEKKPLYHFYPNASTFSVGTLGCNMLCLHCQNASLSAAEEGAFASVAFCPPEALLRMAEEKNSQIISWTYNEPVIWAEYILETMREARARKKKFSSVLVSAGLANPEAWADILALTDACSLDIKGWGNSFYKKLTGFPGFLRVLENAQAAYNAGCHLEIVTNVMQDWNDDDASLVSLAEWIGENLSPDIPWHLTASRPAHKLMNLQPTHIRTIERAVSLGKKAGLRYVYGGNIAGTELQTTSCPECAHALIKRSAFSVQSCLVTQDTQCAERACCPKCGTKIYGRF